MRPMRLVAALSSGAFLLAGCGASSVGEEVAATTETSPALESAEEEMSGTVEVAYTIPSLTQAPLEAAIGAYAERGSGPTIAPIRTGETCVDQPQRLQGDAVAGTLPDLAMVCLSAVRPLLDSGLAQPIEPLLADDPQFDLDQFAEQGLDALRVDGELHGLPLGVSVPILYYNVDQFRQAGLDPEDPPGTFEEVAQAAAALADPASNRAGMLWSQFPGALLFQGALRSAGGAMTNEDETAPAFNSPEGVAVLKSWRELVAAGLMPVETNGPAAADTFIRGDTAMLVHTNSRVSIIENGADFEVGTAPMPVPGDEAGRVLPMDGFAYVMFADEEQEQAAAWAVMKELVSPGNTAGFAQATGFVPSIPSVVDTKLAAVYADNPNQRTGAALIDDSVPVYNWPGARAAEIAAILDEQIVLALKGEVSPEQALDTAAERIRPLMLQ